LAENPVVLVIEDGHEYTETLSRFLADHLVLERAGSGPEALQRLAGGGVDVVFLDMRFDRTGEELLLGAVEPLVDRFNGDRGQARRFRQDHQGTYVLAALREAGHVVPVVMSYDFDGEPRRFAKLAKRFAPVRYLTDDAGPDAVLATLRSAAGGATR
jgi:CheY-like chemotaxis protein